MDLMIDHLETRTKNSATYEKRPAVIFLEADDSSVTPDLATVFRSECEALLPEIFEQAGLLKTARAIWYEGMVGSRICLTTNDRTSYDVYVRITPDIDAESNTDV